MSRSVHPAQPLPTALNIASDSPGEGSRNHSHHRHDDEGQERAKLHSRSPGDCLPESKSAFHGLPVDFVTTTTFRL